TVLKSTSKILLRIEPAEVKARRAEVQIKTEKFLFFFLAREKHLYSVDLEITVNVVVVDTDNVDFTVSR
ncbi:MAG TPA: cytoplasmic protein, partial [Erwinia persicina]|nr:cytoplasmic protein [Erwinia persicina]